MFLKSLKLLALPLALLYAGSAYAFFDAELLLGKRWYELDSDPKSNIASQEIAVAAHLDPIPLVPVSFGLKIASDMLNSSEELHKMRLLEHDIWNPYVPAGIPEGMVVYHWRKMPKDDEAKGVSDYSAFVKLRTRRSSRRIIATYLVIAFLLGVLGNLCASGIQAIWSAVCNSPNPIVQSDQNKTSGAQ